MWPKLIEDVPLILEAADVVISGPRDNDQDLVPPTANVDEGICFNGVADDAHETFYLSRRVRHHFVKTLRKPYDTAVACVLLRAYLLAPNKFELLSDGTWVQIQWKKAPQLYQELWPGEPIWCPWSEIDGNAESSHDKANGEASSKAAMRDEAPPAAGTINATTEAAEILKRLQSDSSFQLESVKSTISEVDFTYIRQWLSRCEEDVGHNECKASTIQWPNLRGVQFKVIDVYRRCIVNAPDGCSFIVLTYVWGGVDQPKLTGNTKSFMMREGGLDAMWPITPLTIRDAITVCERLGERHLWIDALCIMQDSVHERKLQILRMRQIYSAAKCAIVAVSADTAEVGLLGTALANGLRTCDSVDSLNRLIDSSPWSSRAWCYQEKVLSHHAILFTSGGIYMQCQNGTYDAKGTPLTSCEDNQNLAKFNTVGGMLSVPYGKDLESFISAVEHYSQRKLTKQEDRMDAFQGIFRRYGGILNGKKSSFCCGLPISAFDQTFCWRTRLHNPHLRNKAFPSWSWLGWNDAVSFDRKMIQLGGTSQMIYNSDNWSSDDYAHARQLRKPAQNQVRDGNKFGFPASAGGTFYNDPDRWLCGSVGDLRIAPDFVQSDRSNSLFAVFSTKCKIKYIDKDTAAAPSVPATQQTEEECDLSEHDNHEICEAKTLLGYICLDRKWREKQSKRCVMRFMALAGEKDVKREGQWMITMLMCLQRMEKDGHFWANE
ncbi:HET-domain-containing protein [Zopfia rhizophila CBS 207.26]|uniref:HET-domain-containing protein n=1 Tax=Zopfia rhizophila CBS 207.26 TaxID=1314779 RepID=A0A6A6ETV2_9PEZI|nr:HET-domain-containing protein [Zopfia rhizophila CBS 207.26]